MTDVVPTPTDQSDNRRNGVIVVLESRDRFYPFRELSLTFESSDNEVLQALQPIILESDGINILEEVDSQAYTIKSVEESQTKFLFPKSTAG